MGLTTWKGDAVRKHDVTVAKNYLNEDEIGELNRIVTMWLDFAEDQARRRKQVFLKDWEMKLDEFLRFNDRAVIANAGRSARSKPTPGPRPNTINSPPAAGRSAKPKGSGRASSCWKTPRRYVHPGRNDRPGTHDPRNRHPEHARRGAVSALCGALDLTPSRRFARSPTDRTGPASAPARGRAPTAADVGGISRPNGPRTRNRSAGRRPDPTDRSTTRTDDLQCEDPGAARRDGVRGLRRNRPPPIASGNGRSIS